MAIVTSYDWESDTFTHHMPTADADDSMQAHQKWLDAVSTTEAKARQALPTHAERITKAVALILDGHVSRHSDGTFQVKSQSKSSTKTYHVNGQCECPDSRRSSDGLCKHLIASMIWRRAQSLLQEPTATPSEATEQPKAAEPPLTLDLDPTQCTIDPKYVVMIQGKPFVRYAGLLQMALERGLVSLTATWTYNDAELSLAHAVATFADGRRFEESGDASPSNCTRMVAVHFRRVALTRAKARVLRDALGIDLVAVEELADNE